MRISISPKTVVLATVEESHTGSLGPLGHVQLDHPKLPDDSPLFTPLIVNAFQKVGVDGLQFI